MVTFAVGVATLHARSDDLLSNEPPPNVVMIISDDQAWSDYSFMDHPTIQTPNIDQLAKQSVLFRRGYVPTALCRPSLMTMITGRYAFDHGVTGNDPSPKYWPANTPSNRQQRLKLIEKVDHCETLPKKLSAKGYACFQSGKWWEGNFKRGGFTDGMTQGFPNPGGRHGDDGLKIGRTGLKPVTNFIDQSVESKKPFFVWYAPFLPHTPHNPPERLLTKYTAPDRPKTIAKYFAMCDWFDETCGELITHVEKVGQTKNTLIVYVCDNGWIQSPTGKRYAPRSKQTAYEGGIRTPIMFCWPDKFKPADRTELCSSIDLAPTILAATGAEPIDDLPGLNLLSNLSTGDPIQRERIFGESFAHDIADLDDPEKTLVYRWCIEGKWKLLLTYDGEVNRYKSTHPRTITEPQLFNLLEDATEQENLAKSKPAVVQRLSKEIKSWAETTKLKAKSRLAESK